MNKKPLIISALAHIALFLAMTLSVPWSYDRELASPPPIIVEFAEIDKVTQTTKVGKTREIKDEVKEEKPPAPPKPQPAKSTKAEPEPAPEAVPPLDNKKDEKKPKPKEKEEPKKEEQKNDFDSVLRNLAETKDEPIKTDVVDPAADSDAKPEDGFDAPIGEKLTITEEDALRRQLEQCWNVPVGARDVENSVVEIRLEIAQDRTLISAEVVDQSRYNSDTFYRAVAESALRAVRNPACSPFQLPPDKYLSWKDTVVTFNPKDMF